MSYIARFLQWCYDRITGAIGQIAAAVGLLTSGLTALGSLWRHIVGLFSTLSSGVVTLVDSVCSYTESVRPGLTSNSVFSIFLDMFALDYLLSTFFSVLGSIIGVFTLMVTIAFAFIAVYAVLFTYKWVARIIRAASASFIPID